MAERWWSDARLERVDPIGTRTSVGFWDGVDEAGNNVGGFGPLELPEYPPNPNGKRLREARVGAGCSLREAARRMGLRPVELSGIERGSLRFRDPEEYDRVLAELRPGHPAPNREADEQQQSERDERLGPAVDGSDER